MSITEKKQIPVQAMEDNFVRCRRCQTLMVDMVISVRHEYKPYEPIAKVIRCGKCGWVLKRWVIPGTSRRIGDGEEMDVIPSVADKYGITKSNLRECCDTAPLVTAFTLEELKSGKVRGVDKPRKEYNPDRFIEPEEQERVF